MKAEPSAKREDRTGTREVTAIASTTNWRERSMQLLGQAPVLVWLGLILVAAGFTILGFSWSRVAGTLDVGRQMPYVISGGLTAIGLILVGLTLVHIGTARRGEAEHAKRMDRLRATFEELCTLLERGSGAESANGRRRKPSGRE